MDASFDVIDTALLDAFAQRGHRAELADPDTIVVTLADGYRARASIAEWRRYAGRIARADLPALAAQYADQAVRAFQRHHGAVPGSRPGGGRALLAAGNLRVRLYPESALDEPMRAALVTRSLAPGLLQAVVVDHPDSMTLLNRADLGDVSESEAFGEALTRSINDEPHFVETSELNGVKITHIGEQHRYIGAHVHVLTRYFPGPLPFGALVAFPLPEYLMVHEIGNDKHLVIAVTTFQDLAARLAETGEKPISPQVYWWRPGEYELLAERDALYGGRVPDLRPVGMQIEEGEDGRLKVGLEGEATAELVQGWEAARG
ncbi:MAG TPA: hypothetical protein VIL71_21665 [Spirillospora sp.]